MELLLTVPNVILAIVILTSIILASFAIGWVNGLWNKPIKCTDEDVVENNETKVIDTTELDVMLEKIKKFETNDEWVRKLIDQNDNKRSQLIEEISNLTVPQEEVNNIKGDVWLVECKNGDFKTIHLSEVHDIVINAPDFRSFKTNTPHVWAELTVQPNKDIPDYIYSPENMKVIEEYNTKVSELDYPKNHRKIRNTWRGPNNEYTGFKIMKTRLTIIKNNGKSLNIYIKPEHVENVIEILMEKLDRN